MAAMTKKILYGVIGFVTGAILPASALMLDHFFIHQDDSSILAIILRNPIHFFILLYPALFAAAAVLYTAVWKRLSHATEELDYFESQLDKPGQQGEIDKLPQELSANLDHLVEITNNIHEGICVIDRNLNIVYGYNKSFIGMFGNGDYNGKSVFDTIFQYVTGSVKKDLQEYLDLCFTNTATSDDMINGVNPVGKFMYLNSGAGAMQETILKSKVVRMKNQSGDIKNVMFIFNNITLDEKFDVAFEKSEKAFEDELTIMSLIYKNDKDLVINFINEMNDVLEKIQERYMEIEQDRENTRLLNEIQGIVHLIKGEAFSLGFEGIAQQLISNIPRFEDIAEAIGYQMIDYSKTLEIKNKRIASMARMLKLALDFVAADRKHSGHALDILADFKGKKNRYDPEMVATLEIELTSVKKDFIIREISPRNILPGMILADDIIDERSILIVPKGTEMTKIFLMRLLNFLKYGRKISKIKVLVRVDRKKSYLK